MYFNESQFDHGVTFLQYQLNGKSFSYRSSLRVNISNTHNIQYATLSIINYCNNYVEKNLTRKRFATVTNFTFQYDVGFSNEELYPG